MAKILTDVEMAAIIHKAVHDKDRIEFSDSYTAFLEGLALLICDNFGGEVGHVCPPVEGEDLGWTVAFHLNDCVPSDGGVFKDYDTDVKWVDGVED